jgi:hypothetical protein
MTLPEKRLVIKRQGKFAGELSLGAPVVGLAPCILTAALTNVLVWRLMGDIRRAQYQAITSRYVASDANSLATRPIFTAFEFIGLNRSAD